MQRGRGGELLAGRVLLVVNPISGAGAAPKWVGPLSERLEGCGADLEVCRTTGPGDAREAAEKRAAEMDVILVMGGDGTFREVLNGLELGQCALGVLPAGAGNVLAGELGLSGKPLVDMERLMAGGPVDFDIGVCNGERFAAVFGAGIGAEVVRRVEARRRGNISQLNYLPQVLRVVLDTPQWKLEVSVDDSVIVRDATTVAAGNTANYGGPIQFTPRANPCDGALDVIGMRLTSILGLVEPTCAMLLRKTDLLACSHYARGRRVTVDSEDDVPYQLDGDFVGWLPARVRCVPGAVSLLVPVGFALPRGRAEQGVL